MVSVRRGVWSSASVELSTTEAFGDPDFFTSRYRSEYLYSGQLIQISFVGKPNEIRTINFIFTWLFPYEEVSIVLGYGYNLETRTLTKIVQGCGEKNLKEE